MPDVLIYSDTVRSADMRHAVPRTVPDPFLYAERDGTQVTVANSMEAARLRELGLFEVHVHEEYGIDELVASGLERRVILGKLALRAVKELGIERASVPENFPLWLADLLRADGVQLEVDQELFDG